MKPHIIEVTYKLIKNDTAKSIAEVCVFDSKKQPLNVFTTRRGLLTNQMDILERDIPLLFNRVRDLVLNETQR